MSQRLIYTAVLREVRSNGGRCDVNFMVTGAVHGLATEDPYEDRLLEIPTITIARIDRTDAAVLGLMSSEPFTITLEFGDVPVQAGTLWSSIQIESEGIVLVSLEPGYAD